jgi:hypothetical protein
MIRSATRWWRSTSRSAAFFGVAGQLALDLQALAQARRVLGGRDELGAGQVEVAFARAFPGQAQAVTEFEFGLVEVGLDPVQSLLVELAGAQGLGKRPGDDGAWLQDGLVVGQDDRVGDIGVGERHAGALVLAMRVIQRR